MVRWAVVRMPRRVQDGIVEALLRAVMVYTARGVTPSMRFALNELFLVRGTRRYRVRRSGRTLFVRHPMSDAGVVYESIISRDYLPPPPVGEVLSRLNSPRVVDLGAHIGAATLLLLERFPAARVLAVEPQPETAALLRRMIAANRLEGQCEVLQAAAGVAAGRAVIEGFSVLAHLARADTTETVDLFPLLRKYQIGGAGRNEVEVVDVLPLLAGADLVKMDIEGAEWPILQDPRFMSLGISALVVEYHPQGAPEADASAAMRDILSSVGFTVGEPVDQLGGALIWAWRD
jgi:FkbM family methyltransferase